MEYGVYYDIPQAISIYLRGAIPLKWFSGGIKGAGLLKSGVPILGVPTTWMIVFWGLQWGSLTFLSLSAVPSGGSSNLGP